MALANRATDPPAASASITATSLADTIIRAFRAWLTVSRWPRLMASRRAGCRADAREATVIASMSRLARTARPVSILVRLAGGAGMRLRRLHSTAPVAGSTRIAYLAPTFCPGPGTGRGATPARISRPGPGTHGDAPAWASGPGSSPAARTAATRSSRRSRSGRVRRVRMAAAVSHPLDEPDKIVGPVTEGPTCL